MLSFFEFAWQQAKKRTGVKAYTDALFVLHLVDDACKVAELAADDITRAGLRAGSVCSKVGYGSALARANRRATHSSRGE